MKTMINGLMIGLIIMLGGCASLVSGTTQAVSFQSVPDDVTVTLITRSPEDQYWGEKGRKHDPTIDPDGMMGGSRILGKTPFTAQLERSAKRFVVFSKPGYRSAARQLTTGTTGAFWGNILSGGLAGSSTDTVSGAIYEYEPSHYLVTLTPLTSSAVEGSTLHSQTEKIRAFVLLRYASLLGDLSTGRGEDLSALMSLLRIDSGKEAEARHALTGMALAQPDRAAFAATVTERYMK